MSLASGNKGWKLFNLLNKQAEFKHTSTLYELPPNTVTPKNCSRREGEFAVTILLLFLSRMLTVPDSRYKDSSLLKQYMTKKEYSHAGELADSEAGHPEQSIRKHVDI